MKLQFKRFFALIAIICVLVGLAFLGMQSDTKTSAHDETITVGRTSTGNCSVGKYLTSLPSQVNVTTEHIDYELSGLDYRIDYHLETWKLPYDAYTYTTNSQYWVVPEDNILYTEYDIEEIGIVCVTSNYIEAVRIVLKDDPTVYLEYRHTITGRVLPQDFFDLQPPSNHFNPYQKFIVDQFNSEYQTAYMMLKLTELEIDGVLVHDNKEDDDYLPNLKPSMRGSVNEASIDEMVIEQVRCGATEEFLLGAIDVLLQYDQYNGDLLLGRGRYFKDLEHYTAIRDYIIANAD